jgi:hypothetical protein
VNASPSVPRLLLAALLTVAIAGCDDRPDSKPVIRPSGYHPEQFSDIPLPPGFVLRSDHDQLALVLAGGAIRRFSVAMIEGERLAKTDVSSSDVLGEYTRRLPNLGWKSLPSSSRDQQRWFKPQAGNAKRGEILTITLGSSGMKTTATFMLASDGVP